MPDHSSRPHATRARQLNRWGIGSLSALQTGLLAVIVIALNYLAVNHYSRIDLSRGADYSLASSTQRYLSAAALSEREQPVKWIMAFRRTAPFFERVRALAEEYARLSHGKIHLEIVDPLRSPDRMQEITATYGISLVRDLIIIDARPDPSPVTHEEANKTRALNPHVKLVVADDLGVFTTAEGKRKLTGFQGEDVLTAHLVAAIEGHPRKMALLADKSRIHDQEGPSSRKSLEDILRFQNVELSEITLSSIDQIPKDITGIILVAPKYDLTEEELAVLDRYWHQPRAALLVMIDGGETPPRLRAFLRGNGITPRKDRVITRTKGTLVTAAKGIFTQGVDFTRDLAGQTTEFEGASSSLDVREGADDLLNRRIYPMGLIRVLDGFWGETKFGLGNEQFDELEDSKPPLHLAACVTRGAESDDRHAADSSHLLVLSNTAFLEPHNARAENLDFLASGVNWLIGRDALVGIGPRSLGTYKLPLLDAQVSFINRVNLFFLPAFLCLIGGCIWTSRRV